MSIAILVTGLLTTAYCLRAVFPSASAVIVTDPGRCAVTNPNRSTLATVGFELRHTVGSPRRSLLSGLIPFAEWAIVAPV
jgi:hypothetical protein